MALWGVEPEGIPKLSRAIAAGGPVDLPGGTSLADGLLTRSIGRLTWPLIAPMVTGTVGVSDDQVRLLGGSGSDGASPRRLLVSTVGDELKRSGHGASKVIGMSLKDRSAILPSGHMADGAYWYDSKAGNFVSSTYYFADLPEWVKAFNARRLADKYACSEWSLPGAAMRMPT